MKNKGWGHIYFGLTLSTISYIIISPQKLFVEIKKIPHWELNE